MRAPAFLMLLALLPAFASAVHMERLRQAVASALGVHAHHKLSCAECMELAAEIQGQLVKPAAVESDDPGIAAAGPGRRSRMVLHKEPEIEAALDAACGLLAARLPLKDGVLDDCQRLLAEHRQVLTDSIFSGGTADLTAAMCVRLWGRCDPHVVADAGSGEL